MNVVKTGLIHCLCVYQHGICESIMSHMTKPPFVVVVADGSFMELSIHSRHHSMANDGSDIIDDKR